jgi:hypothetical protein
MIGDLRRGFALGTGYGSNQVVLRAGANPTGMRAVSF